MQSISYTKATFFQVSSLVSHARAQAHLICYGWLNTTDTMLTYCIHSRIIKARLQSYT